MKKILITLIHNNNPERNEIARKSIENIRQYIKGLDIHYKEFSYQPKKFSRKTFFLFRKTCLSWLLNRKWKKYTLQKNHFILIDLLYLIYNLTKKIFINKKESLRVANIDVFLTSKHINSYHYCFQNEFDFLLVLEDDFILKEDSLIRLNNLIAQIYSIEDPLYIDLAGGYDLSKLKVKHLEKYSDNSLKYFNKPITNTTCSYLINKKTTELIYDFLVSHPIMHYSSPDWFLNSFFIEQEKNSINFTCIHSDPPIFSHGSFNKYYSSLISIKK